MLTTRCPKCEKDVSVPAAAHAESRVRCPLCSEEYTLESVFADLPPLLELLDAPATNGAAVVDETSASDETVVDEPSRGMFDFDQRDDAGDADEEDGGDIALSDPVETSPKSDGFDFGGGDAPAAVSVGSATTTKRPARARKKASPVKSIIGVIVGGLFALPIAQLTLWYLPGGWAIEQRDPMGIGQKLAGGFASFIVPTWVANPNAGDGEDPEPEPGTANNGQNNDPLEEVDEPGELSTLLGSAHNGDGNANSGSDGQEDNGNGAGDDPPEENGDGNSSDGGEVDPPEPPKPGVKDPPTFASTDLSDEIRVVKEEVTRLEDVTDQTLDAELRRTLLVDFFDAAAKLATVTTFVDKKSQGHLEFLDEILAEAGSTDRKRRYINSAAMTALKDPDRENNGILFTGVVKEIQKRGQLFEAIIAVEGPDNPRMSIYGDRDPSAAMRKDETVIILGVIIDKPKDELRGYKGPPDAVIWGGYSQVIASP